MGRRRKGTPIHGWLVLDKPEGPTSSTCVGRLKYLTKAEKVGHGGTLDPIASGVLPIAFGEATKTQQWAMDGRKTYRFTIRWGESTDTLDSEGRIVARGDARPERAAIEAALPAYLGFNMQIPPKFSAVKVAGERAYARARRDERVEIAPRQVRIDDLRLLEMPDADHAVFEIVCGKGTYVRAVARDLALQLQCEGHIRRLRRTAVGPFAIERAVPLQAFEDTGGDNAASLLTEHLLAVDAVLADIPALALTEQEARRLRSGQGVAALPVLQRSPGTKVRQGDTVRARLDGTLVALARIAGGEIRPFRVMNF